MRKLKRVYMYRLGKRKQPSKKPYIISGLLGLVLLVAGSVYGFHRWAAGSTADITNAPPVVGFVNAGSDGQAHLDEGLFTLDLPTGWKLVSHETPPASRYNLYNFQGSTGDSGTRLISIYQDQIPTSLPVNRVISVQPQGSRVSHGTVSDNCINFASDASRSTTQAVTQHIAQLKWDGVDFLCDLGSYDRNVTGTSAEGSINSVTLTSPTSGSHKFFFVYTDTNLNPDYTTIYGALDSFRLK